MLIFGLESLIRYPSDDRFHVFSASLWNCRLKIPRDARVNAFFAPAIKSNENRWVTQGAVRSRYVFDTYPWPTNINGISEGIEENWSSLLKITVEYRIMTTPLRYQQSYFMIYSSDKTEIFRFYVLQNYIVSHTRCLNSTTS